MSFNDIFYYLASKLKYIFLVLAIKNSKKF